MTQPDTMRDNILWLCCRLIAELEEAGHLVPLCNQDGMRCAITEAIPDVVSQWHELSRKDK